MSEALSRQEQLFGIRDAEFGTLRASNERLYPFFRAAKSLVDEAKIDPTDDGLHLCAVDPANVGMVEATVALDGDVPNETFATNVEDLAGQLQNKPRDVTVTLDCALPSGVLRLDEQFANGRVWDIRERVDFLDPDSVRERPDIPDLDFAVTVGLAASSLSAILKRYPDGHPVEVRAADGKLSIGAAVKGSEDGEGDYHALATTDYDGEGEASALYSQDYLTDILAGVKATGAEEVTLSWGDEFPLQLGVEGEYVTATWFLAPRIKGD